MEQLPLTSKQGANGHGGGLFVGDVLKRIAPRVGATVYLEPEYRYVGQITFSGGRRSYFKHQHLDVNPQGATEIARDKDFAARFMERDGYPVVPGRKFYSEEWCAMLRRKRLPGSSSNVDAAYAYARKIGFPVVVKPNSQSQGLGVCKVYTKREFYQAVRFVFRHDRVLLVQQWLPGHDYRLVVLNGRVISAYRRSPLAVVGDGRKTIVGLMRERQGTFVRAGRDTRIDLEDWRIRMRLRRSKLTLRSVLPRGEPLQLLDDANLSDGGEGHDVTALVHPEYRRLVTAVARDMNLRLCGVDLITEDEISLPPRPGRHWILEINAAPGLDHYATTGPRQRAIVERLYLEVLREMASERAPAARLRRTVPARVRSR